MLKFNIRHQQLSRVDNFRPVEKSLNYLTASFTFLTEDWEDADKKAICKNLQTGETYEARLVNDSCLIPWEVLTEEGAFDVSLWGTKGTQKITTSFATVHMGGH